MKLNAKVRVQRRDGKVYGKKRERDCKDERKCQMGDTERTTNFFFSAQEEEEDEECEAVDSCFG